MNRFPFLSLRQYLIVLRVSVAIVFLAHAIVRIALEGSIAQFSLFMQNKGFPFPTAVVWMITVFEIAGGIALALGYWVRLLSAGFIILLTVGIIIIHLSLGWFVGEHGDGGCEYSFILIVALLVIAADDKKPR
ncbi:DoxX family protein [Pseudoflavitalea sp. G-6-1-2]|uniref:DoxX family protein n=1 Tax=Pseudoflavitalea sp. G-6-1-2 TaxID=2728841 RepID=UPI00146C710A|nr:DoxX family protein [Pseudoflavitalea sp. G-6-1-2]NML19540.1 DoxX family protein [Pseudoflavitalea sp. G-6-1-2]